MVAVVPRYTRAVQQPSLLLLPLLRPLGITPAGHCRHRENDILHWPYLLPPPTWIRLCLFSTAAITAASVFAVAVATAATIYIQSLICCHSDLATSVTHDGSSGWDHRSGWAPGGVGGSTCQVVHARQHTPGKAVHIRQ